MAGTSDISTYAGRLATFDGPVQIVKRRASTTKKSKTPTTVEWPHQTPAPEQLARAGFYYKPSSASKDSVTCFLCNKSLDGWDPEDNPAVEHLNHVPHCGWAINVNIEQRNQDPNSMEEDPMSEIMVEARRATFRNAWPHEDKKGWKCKLEKMVAAGWCHTPLPEADDCVQCFYCGVSLDGWEPKDDPWVEHQKRAQDCQFFTLIDASSKTAKSAKPSKARTSKASRTSRLSTQSNLTMASDIGSIMDLDDVPAEEDDTMMSTMSTVSKAGTTKGRVKKATRKTTKKVKEEALPEIDAAAAESLEADVQEPMEQSIISAKPKATRGRTTRKQEDESHLQIEQSRLEGAGDAEVDLPEPMEQNIMSAKPKATRGRTTRKQEEESQIQIEQSRLEEPPRPKRGKKRGSDGLEKVETSVMPEESVVPPPKQTRGTRRIKDDHEASQIEQSRIESQLTTAATKRGRPAKRAKSPPQESSFLAVDASLSQSARASPELSSLPTTKPSKTTKAQRAAKAAEREIEETVMDEPAIEHISPRPLPQPPQTAAPAPSPVASPVPDDVPEAMQEAQSSHPASPSAQSSDAENHAPASSPFPSPGGAAEAEAEATPKPAIVPITTPPRSTKQAPAAPLTPTTSPTRATPLPISTHQTTNPHPWTAIDLTTVFLPPSPSKIYPHTHTHALAETYPQVNMENIAAKLTKEEREMSIEEWIVHNAGVAEEAMMRECERLVGVFVGGGERAVRTLSGVMV